MNNSKRQSRIILVACAVLLVLSLGFTSLTSAMQTSQDDCPLLVQSALDATAQLCMGMDQDQACYGHVMLDAAPYAGFGPLNFSEPGDVTDVFALRSLRLSAMNVETGVWGLARMELRTSTPVAAASNVTVLVFGDVQVNNAVEPSTRKDATVTAADYVNVRLWPSTQGGVLGTLAPQQKVNVVGRLSDSSWLRVELPDSGTFGWLAASLVTVDDDPETLPVEEASAPHYGPMKAFYFQDNSTDHAIPGCATVPASGILIQTPEGAGEINFLINEVDIRIGSTVFLQGQPGGNLVVSTVEGAARVRSQGNEQIAVAGSQVTVPLGEDLSPVGPPTAPEPYNEAVWQTLPLAALNNPVVIIAPASPAQIQERVAAKNGLRVNNPTGGDDDCPANNCDAPGQNDTCPANNCDAPGQNDTCPANNCDAPSQNDTCPENNCNAPANGDSSCPGNSCNTPGHDDSCPGNSCNAPGHNK